MTPDCEYIIECAQLLIPEQVSLSRLLFPEPVTAGMNPFVLMSLAHFYRAGNEHTVPITVTRDGTLFRISDGRHRAVASMIAGRKTVLATVD